MLSPPPLLISNESFDDALLLKVVGEVDLANVHQLSTALEAARRQRATTLLDLSGVEFMDSTGLKLLLECARRSDEERWTWHIVRPSSATLRLIEASGTAALLPLAAPGPKAGAHWVGAA